MRLVLIDIPNEKLNVEISESLLQERLSAWVPPEAKVKKGYLSIYSKMANTAEKGAALKYG